VTKLAPCVYRGDDRCENVTDVGRETLVTEVDGRLFTAAHGTVHVSFTHKISREQFLMPTRSSKFTLLTLRDFGHFEKISCMVPVDGRSPAPSSCSQPGSAPTWSSRSDTTNFTGYYCRDSTLPKDSDAMFSLGHDFSASYRGHVQIPCHSSPVRHWTAHVNAEAQKEHLWQVYDARNSDGDFVPVRIELVYLPSNEYEHIWRFERLDARVDFDALVAHPAFAKPQFWYQLGEPFERYYALASDYRSLKCGAGGCLNDDESSFEKVVDPLEAILSSSPLPEGDFQALAVFLSRQDPPKPRYVDITELQEDLRANYSSTLAAMQQQQPEMSPYVLGKRVLAILLRGTPPSTQNSTDEDDSDARRRLSLNASNRRRLGYSCCKFTPKVNPTLDIINPSAQYGGAITKSLEIEVDFPSPIPFVGAELGFYLGMGFADYGLCYTEVQTGVSVTVGLKAFDFEIGFFGGPYFDWANDQSCFEAAGCIEAAIGVEVAGQNIDFAAFEMCAGGGIGDDGTGCKRPYAFLQRSISLGSRAFGGLVTFSGFLKIFLRARGCDTLDFDPYVQMDISFPCLFSVCVDHPSQAYHFLGPGAPENGPGVPIWTPRNVPSGGSDTQEMPQGVDYSFAVRNPLNGVDSTQSDNWRDAACYNEPLGSWRRDFNKVYTVKKESTIEKITVAGALTGIYMTEHQHGWRHGNWPKSWLMPEPRHVIYTKPEIRNPTCQWHTIGPGIPPFDCRSLMGKTTAWLSGYRMEAEKCIIGWNEWQTKHPQEVYCCTSPHTRFLTGQNGCRVVADQPDGHKPQWIGSYVDNGMVIAAATPFASGVWQTTMCPLINDPPDPSTLPVEVNCGGGGIRSSCSACTKLGGGAITERGAYISQHASTITVSVDPGKCCGQCSGVYNKVGSINGKPAYTMTTPVYSCPGDSGQHASYTCLVGWTPSQYGDRNAWWFLCPNDRDDNRVDSTLRGVPRYNWDWVSITGSHYSAYSGNLWGQSNSWCITGRQYATCSFGWNYKADGIDPVTECAESCAACGECSWFGIRTTDNYCEFWKQGSCADTTTIAGHDIYEVLHIPDSQNCGSDCFWEANPTKATYVAQGGVAAQWTEGVCVSKKCKASLLTSSCGGGCSEAESSVATTTLNTPLNTFAASTATQCVAACSGTLVQFTITTKADAHEVSWSMGASCKGGPYDNDSLNREQCCLTAGTYTLKCMDSYGDGWQGGSIRVWEGQSGTTYCADFAGGLVTHSITLQ